MKRSSIIVLTALVTVAITATGALAQYPPSKPPEVDPTPGAPVAFTGANISLGMIVLLGLVVVGTVLLLATRRRRVVSGK